MKLISYKAKCGDAFHIQYVGESGRRRNIFLDMGYSKTYTGVLKNVISSMVGTSDIIDVLFLSHIHDDHIGGATKLINDIESGEGLEDVVGRWIYNVPRKYDVIQTHEKKEGVLCGIVSGDIVYEHIFNICPSDLDDYTEGKSFDVDGMKVTLLSPDTDKLNQLRLKYAKNRPICKSETDEASVEAGSVSDDYSTPLTDFNTDSFQEDTSIENASSIAATFEFGDKRILWLADSVPSVVICSLSKMGFSNKNRVHCDAVLLSHHGSAANNSLDLFRMISADRYVISADGINRYCLPNKQTVARIVSASSTFPVNLYLNYNDGRLKRMFDVDVVYGLKSMIDVIFLGDMEAIEI